VIGLYELLDPAT